MPAISRAQIQGETWTFAVSGDSRNCGDFVMPAVAAKVRAEKDAFYWHLGDFRWIDQPDQDLLALMGRTQMPTPEYQQIAWDDFLKYQMAAFSDLPVFLARGNHDTKPPMTRDSYIEKFKSFLDRPEIAAQRKKDGADAAPIGPWYHWVERGVDFITLDNSTTAEFSDPQLGWLRAVLDHDLGPGSGIRTIVVAMHEALPHSTASDHAMDDWRLGQQTGELVYGWLYDARAAGKHVYMVASHSHYYSPDIYNTTFWHQYSNSVVPGVIVGTGGAFRLPMPANVAAGSKSMVYGFLRATVHPDGTVDFAFQQLNETDLQDSKWPGAPQDAIHECFIHNGVGTAQ
jgi:Calcineurin-like phosphoesterase